MYVQETYGFVLCRISNILLGNSTILAEKANSTERGKDVEFQQLYFVLLLM